jgi:PST family polysaccharide transporter
MKRMRGSSLAMTAVRGAAWTIATGIGSRALGLIGTLVLTYFVSREELGEVSDAAVAVVLANQLSTVGVGQYYIARPSAGRDVAWHATVVHVALGFAALAAVLVLQQPMATWMKAPSLGRFLPGLAASALLDRLSYMPERVLARDMRFRVIGVCRTAAEVSYSATSVILAGLGWGGMSIVAANVVRSAVRLGVLITAVPRETWLSPSPFSGATMRAMLRFGLPMSVGAAAGFASRRVDNAIVSGLFGTSVVGAYNLAYNVADVPAVQVGEQIGDVLLPSYAHMPGESRKAALVRSTGLLALATFPLAVGAGAVAPTLVAALLKPGWQDVAPMLALLSALSVVRPVGWTISAYLLVEDQSRADAALEVFKLLAVVGLLLTVGREGPLWACRAVGIAFALHAFASMAVVQALDGPSVTSLVAQCLPPLAACAPLAAAVFLARLGWSHAGVHLRGVGLAIEIIAGAVAYLAAASVVARSTWRDMVDLVKRAARERLREGRPADLAAGAPTSARRRPRAQSLRATGGAQSPALAVLVDRPPCTRNECDPAPEPGTSSAAEPTCDATRGSRASRGR